VSWFTHYETTNPPAFISKFNDVHSKRQPIVALKEVKQWKHETMEDY
jgi:hypothetical protein